MGPVCGQALLSPPSHPKESLEVNMNTEQRITELEILITNQEQTISDLDQVILSQQKIIDRLESRLSMVEKRIKGSESSEINDVSKEPPPPHY